MDIYQLLKTTSAYKAFEREYDANKCAHAYIVYGRDKYITDKLLRLFAAQLFCKEGNKPCLECNDCKRILKDTHPDCICYPLNKEAKIVVSDIDDLTSNASYMPCEGNVKVFLLSGGETMNTASQNKLLKTLEEPCGEVHIFLGTANTESLLSTVKSRCRIIEVKPLDTKSILEYLNYLGYKNAESISRLCGGSLKKALDMAENQNYINMYNFVYSLFNRLNSYDDVLDCMKIFNAYEDKAEILDIMQMYFGDNMIGAVNGTKCKYSIKSLIYFIEKTTEAKRKLELNCNKTAVFEILLNEIAGADKEEH